MPIDRRDGAVVVWPMPTSSGTCSGPVVWLYKFSCVEAPSTRCLSLLIVLRVETRT